MISFGVDKRSAVISDVSCISNSYLVLLQCNYRSIISSLCTDSTDMSVTCCKDFILPHQITILPIDTVRLWDNPYLGMVRLNGSNIPNQGLLEVYCNGEWGTVCDHTFGIHDANAVCQQLGYTNGTSM